MWLTTKNQSCAARSSSEVRYISTDNAALDHITNKTVRRSEFSIKTYNNNVFRHLDVHKNDLIEKM